MAISGLHLSFVGLGFYRMIRRATGSYLLGGAAGISFLLLYILMIGSSVSAIRALIMFCVRVGADMSGRVYDAATSVAVAAAGVIIWRPLSFYDAGFQLSFGAVCGMIFLYPLAAERFENRKKAVGDGTGRRGGDRISNRANHKVSNKVIEKIKDKKEDRMRKGGLATGVRDSLTASICIQIATLPAVLFHYYELPLYSIFLNLIVIPLMSLLLALGFAGSLLCLAWKGGGGFCVGICSLILKLYEVLCKGICLLPKYRIITGRPEFIGILLYSISILTCMLLWNRKLRSMLKMSILAVGILGLIFACPTINHRGLEVTFLDVGQGDGIFMKGPEGGTYLVDGGSSDVKKVGRYRLEPFLKSQGVGTLNYVLISHGDSDHINGVEELIERQGIGVKIDTLVLPVQEVWDEALRGLAAKALDNGIKVAVMEAEQSIREEEMAITCIQPGKMEIESKDIDSQQEITGFEQSGIGFEPGNAASMVLAVRYGGFDMLLTGDVEAEGEEYLTRQLEEQYGTCDWEVLKVAHHGSKNSSTEEFLRQVQPTYAIVSAGQENRYGHPHQETVKRLADVGSKICSTQENGAIIVEVEFGKTLKIRKY